MTDDYLEELRKIAFDLTIEPKYRKDHAVGCKALTELLSNIQESYSNFLYVSNNKRKGGIQGSKNEVESDLMIVDLEFNSFHAKLAPDYIGTKVKGGNSMDFPIPMLKQYFSTYKETFLFASYKDDKTVSSIVDEFDEDERRLILGPLFKSVNKADSYNVIVSRDNKKVYLSRIPKSAIKKLTPPKQKPEPESKETFQRLYAAVIKSPMGEARKPKITRILASQDIPMELMPYLPSKIHTGDGDVINLNKQIEVEVVREEDLYMFSYPQLNIEVWGDTRDDAEDAFNFTFYSLYESIALEQDENLTEDAQVIKQRILDLIK